MSNPPIFRLLLEEVIASDPPMFCHGPSLVGQGTYRFRLWAPQASKVDLGIVRPFSATVAMRSCPRGYWEADLANTAPDTAYFFQVDGGAPRPDPASRFQPDGVHGPSAITRREFDWQDEVWRGVSRDDLVLYELHVGTFSREGSFEGVIPHLAYLRELGVTCIELMPVAQFPGSRNWGYDGVHPFAVQNTYGGPEGLKRLVDSCHRHGMGVALDVVYNHLGPEGNYLSEFGPYFTRRYNTPWGAAINFDGPHSDEVRRFFIDNAVYWVREFHMDALRLDAVHGIFDQTAYPFLEELGDAVHAEAERLNRSVLVIAESDLSDPRLVRSRELGGMGLDAEWADGFHHSLRVLLTGDQSGYYQDYGKVGDLAKAMAQGYVFTGQYSSLRKRRYGSPVQDIPDSRFVVFSQNHDQVGNRMLGERLSGLVPYEAQKVAAAAVTLSPHTPLLFMGEEYGEEAPFLYFVSHTDPGLADAVRRGRKAEFADFAWQGEPPDPQDQATFERSKLNFDLRERDSHRRLHDYYAELLRLRREIPALTSRRKDQISVHADEEKRLLLVHRHRGEDEVLLILCFSHARLTANLPFPEGCWSRILDSADPRWLGSGVPTASSVESDGTAELTLNSTSALLYRRRRED